MEIFNTPLFKRTPKTTVEQVKPKIAPTHSSSKKKNTYVVESTPFMDTQLFQLCKEMPLMVVEINGVPQPKTGWVETKNFPNPAAFQSMYYYDDLSPIMGKKLARTIVEYLDKETLEPIVMLFPTNRVLVRGDEDAAMARLNHASRRDLDRQVAIRRPFIEQFNQKFLAKTK